MKTLKLLALFLALAVAAHAVPRMQMASSAIGVASGSSTTSNTTGEQDVVSYAPGRATIVWNIHVDNTALGSVVANGIRVYVKRGSGSFILQGLSGLLTGVVTQTVASSAAGFSLVGPWTLAAGDTIKVTYTLTAGQAASVSYYIGFSQ